MSKVIEFPRTPSERLGLSDKDTEEAEDIENMLMATFGNQSDYDVYAVSLLFLLVAQLRRRVAELEERLQQREG